MKRKVALVFRVARLVVHVDRKKFPPFYVKDTSGKTIRKDEKDEGSGGWKILSFFLA